MPTSSDTRPAVEDASKLVAAELVGTERVGGARRRRPEEEILLLESVGEHRAGPSSEAAAMTRSAMAPKTAMRLRRIRAQASCHSERPRLGRAR
jgi:hypothetical protein